MQDDFESEVLLFADDTCRFASDIDEALAAKVLERQKLAFCKNSVIFFFIAGKKDKCLSLDFNITASSLTKCCPTDQNRPDQMIKMIKIIKDNRRRLVLINY